MADQRLLDYIKNTEKRGFSEKEIKKALVKEGWPSSEVKKALKEAEAAKKQEEKAAKEAQPSQPQKPSEGKQQKPVEKGPEETGGQSSKPAKAIKRRNPFLVLIFCIITLGIYGIYWVVSTTKELRSSTSSAPNPWLLLTLILPPVGMIVMIYYYWKYSKAINELTGFNSILLFVLWILLGPVAMVISQIELNKKA